MAKEPSAPNKSSRRGLRFLRRKITYSASIHARPRLARPPTPAWVRFEPFEGGLYCRSVAWHGEACLLHAVDVIGVAVEAPGEFFDREELGVVVF